MFRRIGAVLRCGSSSSSSFSTEQLDFHHLHVLNNAIPKDCREHITLLDLRERLPRETRLHLQKVYGGLRKCLETFAGTSLWMCPSSFGVPYARVHRLHSILSPTPTPSSPFPYQHTAKMLILRSLQDVSPTQWLPAEAIIDERQLTNITADELFEVGTCFPKVFSRRRAGLQLQKSSHERTRDIVRDFILPDSANSYQSWFQRHNSSTLRGKILEKLPALLHPRAAFTTFVTTDLVAKLHSDDLSEKGRSIVEGSAFHTTETNDGTRSVTLAMWESYLDHVSNPSVYSLPERQDIIVEKYLLPLLPEVSDMEPPCDARTASPHINTFQNGWVPYEVVESFFKQGTFEETMFTLAGRCANTFRAVPDGVTQVGQWASRQWVRRSPAKPTASSPPCLVSYPYYTFPHSADARARIAEKLSTLSTCDTFEEFSAQVEEIFPRLPSAATMGTSGLSSGECFCDAEEILHLFPSALKRKDSALAFDQTGVVVASANFFPATFRRMTILGHAFDKKLKGSYSKVKLKREQQRVRAKLLLGDNARSPEQLRDDILAVLPQDTPVPYKHLKLFLPEDIRLELLAGYKNLASFFSRFPNDFHDVQTDEGPALARGNGLAPVTDDNPFYDEDVMIQYLYDVIESRPDKAVALGENQRFIDNVQARRAVRDYWKDITSFITLRSPKHFIVRQVGSKGLYAFMPSKDENEK